MCFGYFQYVFGKFQIVGNRVVCKVLPAGKELLVEFFFLGSGEIFCIDRIGNYKHLHSGENARKLALTDILAYLTETVKIGVLTVFQFDMDKRNTVYQQRYIETAVLAVNILLVVL